MNDKHKINLREDIEWSNTWISNANVESVRCLLIGDSVTRGIRSSLEKLIENGFSIDFFGGSFALNDCLFWNYLECFLKSGYKYKAIILNYGFHHGGIISTSEKRKQFKDNYMKLIEICSKNSQYVVFMSGTLWNREYEKYADDTDIFKKNSIVKKLAENNHCIFLDLSKMMEETPYSYRDHVHYEEKANIYVSAEIINTVFKSLFKSEWLELQNKIKNKIYTRYPVLSGTQRIYIYGKGEKAHFLYFLFRIYMCDIEMLGWCVSEKDMENYLNIPVFVVNELPTKDLLIIPDGMYEEEMRKNAKKYGHNNIITFEID